MQVKPKKCRNCKQTFTPKRSTLEVVCSLHCALSEAKKKTAKDWQKEKAKRKEDLMTHKDYVQKLQPIFNKFIRVRDKNQPCISCESPLPKKYDAGHCFPAGHYANLRFNEYNCHAQCIVCNQHKHGNQSEYLLRLPKRIGMAKYERLLVQRHENTKLTINELKTLIIKYREKTKILEGNEGTRTN